MGVRAGYRQTDVGVIPEGWRVVPLSSLLGFQNGVNADRRAYGRGTLFANVMEVIAKPHLRSRDIPGRVWVPRPVVEAYRVVFGDILFNRTSETQSEVGLASVYIDTAEVVFGGFVIRGRPRGGHLDPAFAGFGLRGPKVREQIIARGQGAIRANVGQAALGRVQCPLPPLREQEAIAGALSDADALIESLEQLIAKKRLIKQGAMQDLLTGKKRLPGFSGAWAAQSLGEIGRFSKGKGIRRDDVVANGLPCIRYGEIYTHHQDYVRAFRSFIPRTLTSESQRLAKGDLLFAGSGETAEEIGKCVAFLGDEEAYAGGDIVICSPMGQDSLFLGYLMNQRSVRTQTARMGQGDAVVHISARSLAALRLHLPPLAEQAAIASILSDMDAELTALETKLTKARQIKQGMMQELLTGRIRLA